MNMDIVLKGVLNGATKTQRRHHHQAAAIQAAIHEERGKSLKPPRLADKRPALGAGRLPS